MRNIYILNEREVPVAILNPELPDSCPVFSSLHTEKLEYGQITFEFEIPSNHPIAQHINEGCFIVYPRENGRKDYFKIMTVRDTNENGEYRRYVYAENAAIPELLSNPIRPNELYSYNIEQALNYVLSGTEWTLGEVEQIGVRDIVFDDYTTSLDALHKVLDAFEAEIEFVYEFRGLEIISRKVNARRRRGNEIKKPFVYSIDLVGVEREIDDSQLVTALIGVGKGETVNGSINFSNYEPPDLDTSKYEKPQGADWVGSLEALQRWGKRGRHLFGIYVDESATNSVELFRNTLKALDKYSKPLINYKVSVTLLSEMTGYEAHRVSLGDTIVVKDETFQPELILEARVIEYKHNPFDRSQDEVTLGEFRPILSTNIRSIRDIQNRITDSIRKVVGGGAHVIANSPTPLVDGSFGNFNHSLFIEVTENVHIGHVSVFCQTPGQFGIVQLQLADGTVVEERRFENLNEGENRLLLDFILLKDIGNYRLYGDFSGATWRTTSGLQFPYESGTFKIVGTSSASGYWYHFYDISVGGSGVVGGIGSKLVLGERENRLGSLQVKDENGDALMVIDKDQITISRLIAGTIESPSVVSVSTDEQNDYYIDATFGDDDNDGSPSSPLRTIGEAISRIPRVFGGEVNIYLQSDIYEDIDIFGFLGHGRLTINLNNNTLTGTIRIRSVKARVDIRNGTINFNENSTTAVVQVFQSDYVYIHNCVLYGQSGAGGTTSVVASFDSSFVYVHESEVYNANHSLLRAAYGAIMLVRDVAGTSAPRGLFAEHAAVGSIAGFIPDCTTDWEATFGGQIVYQGTPVVNPGTPQTAPTPPTQNTWIAVAGNSYRTRYNSWRNDNTVRQGQWDGYGLHTGVWLFPASLSSTLTGKSIQKMTVKLTRSVNGGNASAPVYIRWHGYASFPSGAPSVSSEYIVSTFSRGQTKEIVLPPSFYPYFSSGTAKGIAIYTPNTSNDYYAIFDDSATLTVDYT